MTKLKMNTGRLLFLVHGRDRKRIDHIKSVLSKVGLSVLHWEDVILHVGTPTPTTLDVVKKGLEMSRVNIILFTPDETVLLNAELARNEAEGRERKQPRANVIFEAGISLALNRDKTILVVAGEPEVFSDIHGLNYVRYPTSQEEALALCRRLHLAGAGLAHDWEQALSDLFESTEHP